MSVKDPTLSIYEWILVFRPESPASNLRLHLLLSSGAPSARHDIHDYVLEGICKAMDGFHVISVVRTGGGKTTYFSGFMVLLQEMEKLSEDHPLKHSLERFIPTNPLCIIIYPTKGLEEDMAETFNALGIPSLAINEDTLKNARNRSIDLWALATQPQLRCLLLSPEQLASKPFNTALSIPSFYSRIVALDVDEIHLVLTWGAPGFRNSFRDIGNALMRLPRWTTLTGVTATLPEGIDTLSLMRILGLRSGSFVFTRRSNHRPELQFIFRVLRHGLQGWSFPDFDWALNGQRKTIIYCRTISLAFRLFVYLWQTSSPSNSPARRKRSRLYCSLYSDKYNKTSRDIFVNDVSCQFLITTDALKVGNDFPNVDDVINIEPEDPSDILQKGGRAGRRISNSLTTEVLKPGRDDSSIQELGPSNLEQGSQGKMTRKMARLLLSDCIDKEIDIQFANPETDPVCTCEKCSHLHPLPRSMVDCRCSKCQPEPPLPALPQKAAVSRVGNGIVLAKKLTEVEREYGLRQLSAFCRRVWDASRDISIKYLPPQSLLPDCLIHSLLNEFAKLKTTADLVPCVNGFLKGNEVPLMSELNSLQRKFNRMRIALDPNGDDVPVERVNNSIHATNPVPSSYDTFFSTFVGIRPSSTIPSNPQPQSVPGSHQPKPTPLPKRVPTHQKVYIRLPPLKSTVLSNSLSSSSSSTPWPGNKRKLSDAGDLDKIKQHRTRSASAKENII
ncbi:P-loop containing nucleoside triphosphate hydrolase protein [Lentinula detonsa]|uniref:DNA 3'-5' helicase n=1 Tax=Lentinula detonsa TaxID=2804962 RepID=A0A9W8TRF0_9AGAR|nr:P-loop containing nucleoside triphosphate hydrolase protein [Lentinula detonsa]